MRLKQKAKAQDDPLDIMQKKQKVKETQDDPLDIIPRVCTQFYEKGMSGTGGGMSICSDSKIYLTPSGVHKELLTASDLFIIDKSTRNITHSPHNHKLTQCYPLFNVLFDLDYQCIIHTHSQHAVMASLLWFKEFKITHMEMIKGIRNLHGARFRYFDTLVIPIIENTPEEQDLESSLRDCVTRMREQNDTGCAVIVRRHGVFVWGHNWQDAKTQLECLDYLLEMGVKMKQVGVDCGQVPDNSPYVNK